MLDADLISFFVTRKYQKIWKSTKIVNIDWESLYIFWNFWGISGKMWLMIILKLTKNQGFTLSLEDTFSEKQHTRMEGGIEHQGF